MIQKKSTCSLNVAPAPHEGRQWCEDDIGSDWGDPDCDAKAVRYIRADIVEAERNALKEALQEAVFWDSHDETGVDAVWLKQAESALAAGGE